MTLANRVTQLVVPLDVMSLDLSHTSLRGGERVSSGHRVLEFLENFGRGRRACPVLACQLRNRDLTVVTCSVSTIVRRTERGVQSGGDDGLHDGRTGGQHDTPAARRCYLPQSVPLPARVLRTSLIKVRTSPLPRSSIRFRFRALNVSRYTRSPYMRAIVRRGLE